MASNSNLVEVSFATIDGSGSGQPGLYYETEGSSSLLSPYQLGSGVMRGSQTIIGASGVPQILMGDQATFGPGFYVSQDGIDATSNTDPSKWIFNSNQDVFKIVKSGSATVVVSSGDNYTTRTTTVAHGLGYTPACISFIDAQADILPGGRVMTPFYQIEEYVTGTTPPGRYDIIAVYTATVDSTNIYLNVTTQDVDFFSQIQGDWTFHYYLLQETAI